MLGRVALLVLFGWISVTSVHANSIVLSDTSLAGYRVPRRVTQPLETPTIFSIAWAPRNGQNQLPGLHRIHFCGRPCSAMAEFQVRLLGIAEPMDKSEFIGMGPRHDSGMGGWLFHFLRRQLGGRVGHKMCKASGTC